MTPMKKKGVFITFEGTDGVGKTTHIRRLSRWLAGKGRSVVTTREPGGGRVSERIRSLLLDPKVKLDNWTELFLYEAARAEHLARVIRPALAAGRIVLCDRFTDATLAYQGYARGLPLADVVTLNRLATRDLRPDLTLWFDRPATAALDAAIRARRRPHDRVEREGGGFQERVRRGYARVQRSEPGRVTRILVQPRAADTQTLVRAAVEKRIRL